ncbi:LysR family transcriptional regulator [Bordetella sp. H567]|uniref:LysR family transcriptional regulator n=1 Tax=Bordetella sp. H567 TaxID=1697043 RepID=UPI0011AB300C|nr:LysR family transcriptional regulator [Bordetella sp. H567]
MHIRQLETFIRIVDTGSFAGAAQAMHATQSTISARMRELEASLGVPLFDRSGHRAVLTPRGRALLARARQMVGLAADIARDIGDAHGASGIVRIGVAGLVAMTWLPRLMAALRQRFPAVTVQLEIALTTPLVERLATGELDLAIATGPVHGARLACLSLGYDEFVWMGPPGLALPPRALSPAELAELPVLGLSEASHHYPVIEQWFSAGKASYQPVVSCSNVRVLADLTMAGLGVSLLPLRSCRQELEAGQLRRIDARPALPPVEFVAVHKRDVLDPLVGAIAALARETSEFPAIGLPATSSRSPSRRQPARPRSTS